ncbi:hypothetical protein DW112_09815, partial [Collinsella sp. AM09-41]
DRMIAIIHPIQTRRIHLLMSEEHLIASTVKTLCRGMRYPNCDIRALFMKDRMIAIIHPIQTRRIHLYMSEEHLIASTVNYCAAV